MHRTHPTDSVLLRGAVWIEPKVPSQRKLEVGWILSPIKEHFATMQIAIPFYYEKRFFVKSMMQFNTIDSLCNKILCSHLLCKNRSDETIVSRERILWNAAQFQIHWQIFSLTSFAYDFPLVLCLEKSWCFI